MINSAIITLTTQVCGERREKMCEKSAYSNVLHLRGTWPMEAIEIGERERGMFLCLLHRSSHTLYCWLDPSHCITFSSFAEQKEILLLAKGLLDLRSQFWGTKPTGSITARWHRISATVDGNFCPCSGPSPGVLLSCLEATLTATQQERMVSENWFPKFCVPTPFLLWIDSGRNK